MRSLAPLSALALLAACSHHHGSSSAGAGTTLAQVVFETRSEIAVGPDGASDAVLADFDGDRHLDVITASVKTGKVQILLGRGNGTFQNVSSFAVSGGAFAIRGHDLDGDGDLDLVVLRPNDAKFSVFQNDGRANFLSRAEMATLPRPLATLLADCNGDGKVDVVVSSFTPSGRLQVFHGAGNGTFAPPIDLALDPTSRPAGLAAGDATGDGLPDLVVADNTKDQVVLFPATPGGHGVAQRLKAGLFPMSVAVGDVNGDGKNDIVVGSYGERSLSIQTRDGIGWVYSRIPLDGPPADLAVFDADGDARNDVVVSMFDHAAISIVRGLPGGGLGDEMQLSASALPYRPLFGDVNEDGRRDLVVSCTGERMSLFLGRAEGGLYGGVNYATGIDGPQFVVADDLDGDGLAEVVVSGDGGPKVSVMAQAAQTGTTTNKLVPALVVDVGKPCFGVSKGDFNKDGRTDIAVACNGGIKLLLNASQRGQLAFTAVPSDPSKFITPGVGPFEVIAHDMNRDGADDFVITDASAHTVTVVRAVVPSFNYETNPEAIALPGEPIGLAIADFTGDRIPDVAVALLDKAAIRVLRNDGQGRLEVLLDVPVAAGPVYLRTADFDEDGRADLVVSNGGADSVTVLLAQPSGFLPLQLQAGRAPTALLSRDLNRDGHADILVASFEGADFRVMLGDGKGGFPTQMAFAGTYRATSADLADVTGDGLPELMLASLQTTRVSVYRNLSK